MLPGVSSKRSREPAKGWSDLLETSRTRMTLCLDLNLARVLTRSIGIPSWEVLVEEMWDLWVNGVKNLGLDGR